SGRAYPHTFRLFTPCTSAGPPRSRRAARGRASLPIADGCTVKGLSLAVVTILAISCCRGVVMLIEVSRDQAVGSERRGAPRYALCLPVQVRKPDGSERPGVLRDLSASGARLVTKTKLVPGHSLELELQISDDAAPRRASARVVRVAPLDHERMYPW